MQNKLSNTEAKISSLEKELKQKDQEMAQNYKRATEKPHFLENYQKKKKELESLMKAWEVLQGELEELN